MVQIIEESMMLYNSAILLQLKDHKLQQIALSYRSHGWKQFYKILCFYHKGRVTQSSIIVPGGGFVNLCLSFAKNLALILFFTTTNVNLGLKQTRAEN